MKASSHTWLLGTTGALVVFYFVFDIQLDPHTSIVLVGMWIASFCLDIKSTFAHPELFQYESNQFFVILCDKFGKMAGCLLLGTVELLVVFVVTLFFTRGNIDIMSFAVIAACVGIFHLLWYNSNKNFAKAFFKSNHPD